MRIGVIGAGRVGTAAAVLLRRAGHEIVAVSGREATATRAAAYLPGVPVADPRACAAGAELVLLGVPDDAIEGIATTIAPSLAPGTWVVHMSGAHGLAALEGVRPSGARALAVHPLMTFPDVDAALAALPGSTVAVTAEDPEGEALGERLAGDLGGVPFRLPDGLRPLYHAAAVFASNDVVAVSGIAARLFARAGVPDPVAAMAPLQRATIDNVARLGPETALTGPAVRGDAGTIRRNLEALQEHAPSAIAAYVVLCRAALELGSSSGRLSDEGRAAVEEVLDRWT